MSELENEAVCYVCEKVEPNLARLISCAYCGRFAHFRCKKLFGNVITKVKKNPYLCSVECSEMNSHTNQKTVSFDAVVAEELQGMSESKKEASQLRYVVEQSRLQLAALVKTSGKIEESQQFLSNQFDTLQSDFRQFKLDMDTIKTENEVGEWQRS